MDLLCCPLNCLPGKTWACLMSSWACYPLLPSASAYNAPLPSAPPVEQFYCFHKFCMIHISSSLSPLHSDTPSFSAPPHLLSLAVSESRWMSDRNISKVAVGSWGCFVTYLYGFIISYRFSSGQCFFLVCYKELLRCPLVFKHDEINKSTEAYKNRQSAMN